MRRLLLALLIIGATAPVAAQSSQFGIRGLGHPGRASSVRTLGTGGAFGLFDGESTQNPAALASLGAVTSAFTASTSWRTAVNPGGEASAQSTRFPLVLVGGPVGRTRLSASFSYSSYTDRDFTLASSGIISPRGVPVAYSDTLSSRGGINDLRVAGSWKLSPRLSVGAGVHFLTGSNRLSTRRVFDDSSYIAAEQRAELAYNAIGVSAGFVVQPRAGLAIAGSVRRDGPLDITRDSTPTGTVDLPLTLMGGVRLRVRPRIEVAGQVASRNWSVGNEQLRAEGATGARNTFEASGGVELISNTRRPGQRPLRLGVRYAKLPFLIAGSPQPEEWGVSAGTGMRFRPSADSRDVGGIDLTVERIQRKSGTAYTESAWLLSVGLTIFTGGAAQ